MNNDGSDLIVERLGDEAIVFDPQTDEVHHLDAAAAQAFAEASDDVSRRSLLRGGLIVGSAAAVTSILAPTAASAMCISGSAGPLGSANGFSAFTTLSSTPVPALGQTQFGQFSAFTATGTLGSTGPGTTTPMTWNGVNQFQNVGATATVKASGSAVALTTTSPGVDIGLVFTAPSTGYLFGTGAEALTTDVVTNPAPTAGGTHNFAWSLYKVVSGTYSQIVASANVAKNSTANIQSAIESSGFAGLFTVGAHQAIPLAAGNQLAIVLRFTDATALTGSINITWQ